MIVMTLRPRWGLLSLPYCLTHASYSTKPKLNPFSSPQTWSSLCSQWMDLLFAICPGQKLQPRPLVLFSFPRDLWFYSLFPPLLTAVISKFPKYAHPSPSVLLSLSFLPASFLSATMESVLSYDLSLLLCIWSCSLHIIFRVVARLVFWKNPCGQGTALSITSHFVYLLPPVSDKIYSARMPCTCSLFSLIPQDSSARDTTLQDGNCIYIWNRACFLSFWGHCTCGSFCLKYSSLHWSR